ncbi:MAG: hypothetical protein H6Q51_870 [Deltaproteobacteria bacterium]|nr:hypothetical protein [Deltaproteobacteria bacterium]
MSTSVGDLAGATIQVYPKLIQNLIQNIPDIEGLSCAQGYGGQGIICYSNGYLRFPMEQSVKVLEECDTSGENNTPLYEISRQLWRNLL